MKIDLMLKAKEEAQRFINDVEDLMYDEHDRTRMRTHGIKAATVKRRSMDLTRSLSKMRQGK